MSNPRPPAASAIGTQPVKGMRDFTPDELQVRNWLFAHWRDVAESYGYAQYDSCVVEHEELYVRKAGDEITGQLYGFEDRGGRRLALRPELTPSLVRMLMARAGNLVLPARWYAIGQCFRYERAQKGRTREHYQWNMDIVGLAGAAAEVELMSAQVEFLRRVGLAGATAEPGGRAVVIRLSNRKVIEEHLAVLGVTGDAFAQVCVIIDKRDKIGADATRAELGAIGIDTATADAVLALLEVRGLDALRQQVGADSVGVRELTELFELAAASGIDDLLQVDLSIVRGLSYYTGTVWELFDTAGTVPRAIAGGGRYDRLMEQLGGPAQPMVGFGFGDVVITLLLAERGLLPAPSPRFDEMIWPMTTEDFPLANRLAAVRRAAGQRVLVDYSLRRFKHVIRQAETEGAHHLYVLGESERAAGVVKVRALDASRSERDVPIAEILAGG